MSKNKVLPLRRCVGIMLINSKQKIWIGRRIKKPHDDPKQFVWQMPQGGIDKGEAPEEAALRELEEETGVTKATVIMQSKGWHSYELPQALMGKALKGKYRGQTQKWFVMSFEGSKADIDISDKPDQKAEFDDWRWEHPSKLPGLIVPFKRHVYEDVINEFSPILKLKK